MYNANNLIKCKKGFTLIELLAVIVILAIIALISVPIVLDLISDAKNESNKRSIDLYGKAIELAIARKNLTEEVPVGIYKTNGNTLTLGNSEFTLNIEYDGSKVECDFIQIHSDMSISLDDCKINGEKIDYSYGQIYKELEYLESTGTQYIDTGIKVSSDLKFESEYEATNFNDSPLFGGLQTGHSKNSIFFGYYTTATFVCWYSFNSNINAPEEYHILNTKYKLVMSKEGLYINNNLVKNDFIDEEFNLNDLPGNISLFANYNCELNRVHVYGRYKIYYFKIWNKNELLRDFIPVLDNEGKPCMYELKS